MERLIILLAFTCGLRRSEIVGLRVEDFNGRNLAFIGKGQKYATITIPRGVAHRLTKYIGERKYGYIFESPKFKGRALSKTGLNSIAKRVASRAGFDDFHIHELRYSFATYLKDCGVSLRSIQVKLRHSSQRTTELYIQYDDQVAQDEYDRCFVDF